MSTHGGKLIRVITPIACIALLISTPTDALAQNWKGFYVGGSIGAAMQPDDDDETVTFDTNLDGTFTDTIRTVAGANAFSPGFCGGLANGPAAAAGCADDEDGIDFGGRAGYDWQVGPLVFGAVAELSRPDVRDSVTTFSITPAFYSFTRELNMLAGLRGRVGAGTDRIMVYGTAGAAWGWVDQAFTTSNAVNTFVAVNQDGDGDSQGATGYQAGGGIEVKLGARLSVVGEYLFTSLDNRDESTIRTQGPAPATNPFILVNAAGTELRRTDRFDFQSARVGLNFRF